jgi:hypothetical protein
MMLSKGDGDLNRVNHAAALALRRNRTSIDWDWNKIRFRES